MRYDFFVIFALSNLVACSSTPAAAGGDASISLDVRLATDVPVTGNDAGSLVGTFCANTRRLGCMGASNCEQQIGALLGSVPNGCRTQADAFLQCAVRLSAMSCFMGPPAQCNAENAAVNACAMPADAAVSADVASAPDAGVADDTGAQACPNVAGRYTAMTAAGQPSACPLGVVTLTRVSGAACRYALTFQNDSMETFAVSAATVDLDMNRAVTGEGSVMTGSGTRRVNFGGRIGEVPGDRPLQQTEMDGTFICEWGLSPKM